MRWPFRIRTERQVEVRLYVELGFNMGRLADLIQSLARAQAVITDLEPDRTVYHVGMPERSAQVLFLARTVKHKKEILSELSARGFVVQEMSNPIR